MFIPLSLTFQGWNGEGKSCPTNVTNGKQYLLLQNVPLESKADFAEQPVH